jgi:signal transduction histidine kinase
VFFAVLMSSTAAAHRLFATRPRSGALLDVGIAAAALAGSLALLSRHGIASLQPGSGELDWAGGLLAACSTAPLLAWRRAPYAAFALTASASVLLGGLGYSIWLPLGPTAALYLFVASRDEADPWTRRDTGTVVGLLAAYLGAAALGDGGFPGTELLHTGLAWAVAWFAGERTRLRREQIAELKERVIAADREAERERRLALAEERARIARDLHDSAGHAINVIAVRAGAARMRHDRDPERSRAALEAIEEVARQTAGEIDQIVGTLRDRRSENREVGAPPGLASLQTLVAHHSAGGAGGEGGNRGFPATAWGRRRPGRLPDPPGGAHQRRAPRHRCGAGPAGVRGSGAPTHGHQPRAGGWPGAGERRARADRHARARDSARRQR